jgi:hypothetical protein
VGGEGREYIIYNIYRQKEKIDIKYFPCLGEDKRKRKYLRGRERDSWWSESDDFFLQ